MRLADFILANIEPILVEWEAFARTCTPASTPMDIAALRDHAELMLRVIAKDLATPQGRFAQSEKSKGRAPAAASGERTAAEEHGSGRAQSGFSVAQMTAEYRALRASVVRLWVMAQGPLDAGDIDDLTRFHEAIDQALAESVARFNDDSSRPRRPSSPSSATTCASRWARSTRRRGSCSRSDSRRRCSARSSRASPEAPRAP